MYIYIVKIFQIRAAYRPYTNSDCAANLSNK